MKRKIIKGIILSIFLIGLSGCGIQVAKGRNPNIESIFEGYFSNSRLAEESEGYCDNLVYEECEAGYEISGKGVLWGDITLCEIDMKSNGIIHLSGEVRIEDGNYKIIKVDKKGNVEVLVEDDEFIDRDINLDEGKNFLKVVGKPVSLKSVSCLLEMYDIKKEDIVSMKLLYQLLYSNEGAENEKDKIEEGDFTSVSYVKKGNILLKGTGINLNGKKILGEFNLSEEVELEIDVSYMKKNGQCKLILIDGNGEEIEIENDITEGKKEILLSTGENTLILDGVNTSFLSIVIESNVEEIINDRGGN